MSTPSTPSFPILLLDGGLGTTLSSPPYNITYNGSTPTWSSHLLLSSPSTLAAVHRSFLDAGADIISTATYQASVEGFARTPRSSDPKILEGRPDVSEALPNASKTLPSASEVLPNVSEVHFDTPSDINNPPPAPPEIYTTSSAASLMRSAIPLALSTFSNLPTTTSPLPSIPTNPPTPSLPTNPRRPNPSLSLSLGPYGATLLPSTDYIGLSSYPPSLQSVSTLAAWHYSRLKIYASAPEWAYVQYIAFETIVSAEEVRAIRDALVRVENEGERVLEGKRVWVCTVVPEDVHEYRNEGESESEDECENGGWEERVRGVVAEMVRRREGEGGRIWGLGVNCTAVGKLKRVLDVVEGVLRDTEGDEEGYWAVVYPDGTRGEKYDPEKKEWVESEGLEKVNGGQGGKWEDDVMDIIRRAEESGVWNGAVVGGCCKTGSEEIRKLRNKIDQYRENLNADSI